MHVLNRISIVMCSFARIACGPSDDEPQSLSGLVPQALVYGADDRIDYYESSDPRARELVAETTIAMVDRRLLTIDAEGGVSAAPDSSGELYDLCPDEPFVQQPSLAQCSAVLIGDDL